MFPSLNRAWIAPGLFLFSFLLLWVFVDRTAFGLLDEGLIVYGAERVMEGDRQYRDFWSLYGPGQFWTLAALFKAFGPSLLVERLWDSAVKALLATFAYQLTQRLANRPMALVAWIACLGWVWAIGAHGYALFPATLLALIAAYFVITEGDGPPRWWPLAAAAVATALAAMYRQDVGACVFVSISVFLFMREAPIGPRLRRWSVFAGLTLLAYLPAAIYLLIAVPFADLVQPLFTYPATVYAKVRGLPYPSISLLVARAGDMSLLASAPVEWAWLTSASWAYYFPILAAVVVVAGLLLGMRGDASIEFARARTATCFLVLLMALLFLIGRVRPFPAQLVHVYTLSIIVACIGVVQLFRLNYRMASGSLAVALAVMALFPAAHAGLKREGEPSHGQVVATGRGSGFLIPADQADAIEYVKTHVPEGEPIFVASGRHDIVFASDVMFYFLAQRRSATKYYEFQPGVVSTALVQAQMVAQLARERVQYVVVFKGFDHIREPNESAQSSGVRTLDDYLEANFAGVAEFGRYSVRKRR